MSDNVRIMEPVDFHGQKLTVVSKDDQPYVAMRAIVDGMGLDWASQYRKFVDDGSRWGVVMMTTPSQGGEQTSLCLPLRKLTGWLMTLQPSRMAPEVAANVLVYQAECDDALWDYWTKGAAVNPRATMSKAELFLMQAQAMVDAERRAAAAEAKTNALAVRVDRIEARAIEAQDTLIALPAPAAPVPERPESAMIGALVRNYCHQTGVAFADAWGTLYRQYRDRWHMDIKARHRNAKAKGSHLEYACMLDQGDEPGTIARLYALAHDLFFLGPKAEAKGASHGV